MAQGTVVYFYQSTHLITVTLTDTAGAPVVSGTVDVTFVDSDGVEISGQTWPLTLSETSPGVSGIYTGTVEHDLVVAPGDVIYAQVTATDGGSTQRYAEVPVPVRVDRD